MVPCMLQFLAGVPKYEENSTDYCPPAKLDQAIKELEASGGERRKKWMRELREGGKVEKRFSTSFVHDGMPDDGYGDGVVSLVRLLDLLHAPESAPSWLSDLFPLSVYGHADLNLANILVDVQHSLWLIDFAQSCHTSVFTDSAKASASQVERMPRIASPAARI